MSLIEKKGVLKVEEALLNTNRINPNIMKNDKTPIWDGELYVYNKIAYNENFSNDSLIGRIPVQVKGVSVKSFSNRIRVEKKYLDKFSNENGTIYYVVQFCNEKFKIFYYDFLNHKVKAILRKMEKQSICITFEELPDDSKKVYNIHKKFLEDAQKQIIQNKDILCIEDVLKTNSNPKFNFELSMDDNFSLANIKKCILEQKPYLYYDQNGVLFPLEQLGKDLSIYLCGQKSIVFYFESENVPHNLDIIENEIGINKVIIDKVITIDENKLEYKITSNINEFISTLTIVEKVLSDAKIKIINVDEYINIFSGNNSSQSYQEIHEFLKFYNKLLKLLDFLKVKKEIDLSLMTEEHVKNTLWLYDCLILNKTSPIKIKDSFFKTTICNITILLLAKTINDNIYVYDFFKNKEIKLLFNDTPDFVSNYFALITGYPNSNGFLCVDNLDYVDMAKEVLNGNKEKWYLKFLSYYMLALIDKYDSNNDMETLELADNICNFLLECEENVYTKLNYYQIKYRKHELSKDDKKIIVTIKNSSNDIQLQCGAALLLECYYDFEFYYKKLSKELQEEFKKYPIYFLCKDIRKEE